MGTVVVFTAERMKQIEDTTIVSGYVDETTHHLMLETREGTLLDAGYVKGDQGIQGLQGLQGIQGIQGIQGEKGDPGAPATALLNVGDTATVDLTLSGAGTPANPWLLKADVLAAMLQVSNPGDVTLSVTGNATTGYTLSATLKQTALSMTVNTSYITALWGDAMKIGRLVTMSIGFNLIANPGAFNSVITIPIAQAPRFPNIGGPWGVANGVVRNETRGGIGYGRVVNNGSAGGFQFNDGGAPNYVSGDWFSFSSSWISTS